MSIVFNSAENSPHLLGPELFGLRKAAFSEGLELLGGRFVAVVSTCFGSAEVVHIALDPAREGWLHGYGNLARCHHMAHVLGPVPETRQVVLVVCRPYFISIDEHSLRFNRGKTALVELFFFALIEMVNGRHTHDVVGSNLEARFPVFLEPHQVAANARAKRVESTLCQRKKGL